MATALDDKILPKVTAILAKFGKNVTYTAFEALSGDLNLEYDPTRGKVCAEVSTDYTVKAAPPFDGRKWMRNGGTGEESRGSAVLATFMTIIAAEDLEFTPRKTDKITFDSVSWQVTEVEPIYSGELVAAYMLRISR